MLALFGSAGVFSRFAFASDRPGGLIINSAKPKDYEMPDQGFLNWITPVNEFFVRCHHYVPDVKVLDWRLKVDGLVSSPLSLALDDLKKLPQTTIIAVLECAGNGRAFYEPHVPGVQWRSGAVGNGKWTGVRLRDVLQKAGVGGSAKHVLFDGADEPMGNMPDFRRTIPIEKALHEDTLLAFNMNDRPITKDHGFALRVVVPGWAGDSWAKWVTNISVLDHEFDGFWMKTAYRHPTKAVVPGTSVPPSEMIPVTNLPVKSVIANPSSDWIMPASVRISGAAWSNGTSIVGVDVSTDDGSTWLPAKLGEEQAQYAWRFWHFDWKAAPGSYTILARAKDSQGNIQALKPEWNPSGYLWNVARRKVTVSTAHPTAPVPPERTTGSAPAGYGSTCHVCHDEDMIKMQRLTPSQWDREIKKMEGWGAVVKPGERDALVKYLSDNYKP
jgi:DMSO/TMAO reductase YedYZ molybdopterin-dependent catalytic subunit